MKRPMPSETTSSRERYRRITHFQTVDRLPVYSWNFDAVAGMFWDTTVERWHKEGLPRDRHLEDYFGFDRREKLRVSLDPFPPFEEQVLNESEEYITRRRSDDDSTSSMAM